MYEKVRVGQGVDLAKHVITVHAADTAGQILLSRPLVRVTFLDWCVRLPAGCMGAMEASSSHPINLGIRNVNDQL